MIYYYIYTYFLYFIQYSRDRGIILFLKTENKLPLTTVNYQRTTNELPLTTNELRINLS